VLAVTIRVVLVEPQLAANIGAAARAMKTMGWGELHLVTPRQWPHPDAGMMAAGADDVLARAVVHADLDSALAGVGVVAGLSARLRQLSCPVLAPRAAAPQLVAESVQRPVAVLFGRERTGLSNDEVDRCHLLINIPANPDYPSLNLAASVQVMAYELRLAQLDATGTAPALPVDGAGRRPLATAEQMQQFYAHLEKTLTDLDFLRQDNPRALMRRLRLLFGRARPDDNEVRILRGILAHADLAVAGALRSRAEPPHPDEAADHA